MIDRPALNRQALGAATTLRARAGFDQFGPADPHRAAERLGVKVVYMRASMEGFYFKGPPSRILISSVRPVPRRTFTCAHELGHHWFGHGSTMDELKEDERSDSQKPEEVLANAFAAFFLMPTAGVRGAFARRNWSIKAASPEQFFTIACEFGVGYRTLINHLHYSIGDLPTTRAKELLRTSPQKIREGLIGGGYGALLLIDSASKATVFEVEQGSAVLLPEAVKAEGVALEHVGAVEGASLYHAVRRGTVELNGLAASSTLGVMPKEYQGAAAYRFLEDPDEE